MKSRLSNLPSNLLFEVNGFERASVDRFWIGVEADDPRFDDRVREELEAAGALRCERIGAKR